MRAWICGAVLGLMVGAGCERMPAGSTTSPAPEPSAAESAAPVVIPPPPPAPPASVIEDTALLEQAEGLRRQGDLAGARALLQPLAEAPGAGAGLVKLLSEINRQIVFTPAPAPQKVDYTIVAGDSLGKIAQHHGTTIELLKQANNLASDLIRTGNRLRIYQGQFALQVDKRQNTLTVTDHGRFFIRYAVGTGEYSKTPVGQFKITSRIKDPTWWRGDRDVPFGDPENILGTRWLGLDIAGYGIHGTWDESSIGKQASAGCVRLRNADVEELHTLLPLGTPVTIHE